MYIYAIQYLALTPTNVFILGLSAASSQSSTKDAYTWVGGAPKTIDTDYFWKPNEPAGITNEHIVCKQRNNNMHVRCCHNKCHI